MASDSQNPDQSERRGSQRHPIELKVEYKRLNTFFGDYTRNISKGGTFVRTTKPLEVGTELVFALTIPKIDEPVKLRGRVVWVIPEDKATEEAPAGMGISFQWDTDEERVAFEEIVERLMKDQLGEHLSAKLLGRKPH